MNEVLGTAPCPTCEGTMAVMQAKRKGAHLYSRCDQCGIDQRTGAKVQQYLWDHTEWRDGPPPMPAGVDPTQTELQPTDERAPEPAPTEQPSLAGTEDWSPSTEAETDAGTEQAASADRASGSAPWWSLAGILLLMGSIWTVLSGGDREDDRATD